MYVFAIFAMILFISFVPNIGISIPIDLDLPFTIYLSQKWQIKTYLSSPAKHLAYIKYETNTINYN